MVRKKNQKNVEDVYERVLLLILVENVIKNVVWCVGREIGKRAFTQ